MPARRRSNRSKRRSAGAVREAGERLGIEKLRPGQREAVEALLEGRDTLAVMPTGWGKSAIYQMAGIIRPRSTVVVSPLLALQQDQIEAIEDHSAAAAARVNSLIPEGERREVLEDVSEDELEFLLLAPEQLENREVLARLRAARPSLFVVDEAHCISHWGHDFRPAYLGLGAAIETLGHPTVLALTATAATPVREEIVERLGMRRPEVLVRGFDRPNIWLGVEPHVEDARKRAALVEGVVEAQKPGIVYAATRKGAEETASELEAAGVAAAFYHAGMRRADRERVQERFMDDHVEAVVATTAFGMGVDKPNVRFVYHLDVSESLDSYYQEIGRAGRDGEPARTKLFYRPQDLGLRRFFAGTAPLEPPELRALLEALRASGGAVSGTGLKEATGLSRARVTGGLAALEDAHALRRLSRARVVAAGRRNAAAVVRDAVRAQERRAAIERSRVEMMRSYADTRDCRRSFLLGYFGEAFDPPCGNCDNCQEGAVAEAPGRREFAVGRRVRHRRWGEGTVQREEAGRVVVLFDEVGYRTLSLDVVSEEDLLERVG